MSSQPAPSHDISNLLERADNSDTNREPAEVACTPDGEPVGVAVYLTADDLRALGLVPDGVKAVVPVVTNGVVLLQPAP